MNIASNPQAETAAFDSELPSHGLDENDRIGLTLFFAAVAHAFVALGVSFDLPDPEPAMQTVEVTLARAPAEKPVSQADYLAQHDQEGAGTLSAPQQQSRMPVAGLEAPSEPTVEPLNEVRPAQPALVQASILASPAGEESTPSTADPEPAEPEAQESTIDIPPGLLTRSLEIATLEARLAEQQAQDARRLQQAKESAAATRQSGTAFYIDNLRKELERIGNLNYPEEARRRKLQGRVRISMLLQDDGSVERIRVLETSGHRLLDDAVVRIIRLAAPFPPFTDAMRADMSRLEIVRTFDFQSGLLSF